jgi:hypothetical protein
MRRTAVTEDLGRLELEDKLTRAVSGLQGMGMPDAIQKVMTSTRTLHVGAIIEDMVLHHRYEEDPETDWAMYARAIGYLVARQLVEDGYIA